MAVPTPVVNVKNQLTALQRTVVSFIIGFIIMQAARLGLNINDPAMVSALTVLIGGVWYAVFHYAETKWNVAWGWLLGKVGAPRYQAVLPLIEPVVAPAVNAALADASAAITKATNVVEAHTAPPVLPTPPAPPVS